ncbi:mxaJ protein [Xanthomonas translucens]
MSVRRHALSLGLACLLAAPALSARELRVCADPSNLPFSDRDLSGLENRLMQLLARDLGAELRYTWWPQRRGALRNTLGAGRCDIVPGIASGSDAVATTRPYYATRYAFVARRGSRWAGVAWFDDPRLRDASIGVQLVGDDGANPPPAHALAQRGLAARLRGFMVYGDYAQHAPQAQIVDAVAAGRVDVAVVWGPTAGYFAAGHGGALQVTPVALAQDGAQAPMRFTIAIGVRRGDEALRRELDAALQRHAADIAQLLRDYHVPVDPDTDAAAAPER